jgi:hypothetical protein
LAEIPSALSLQGCLAQALAPVVARALVDCGYTSPLPHAADRADLLPTLRFSRDPQDIAYLYRPSVDHSSPISGKIPADLTAALVAQWTQLSDIAPSRSSALRPVGADPGDSNPAPLVLVDWGTYLGAHTTTQALPSGQILLRPTATALEAWLWGFAHACPPPPNPTAAAPIPFPQKQAPLAEALHLSPLVLLQYTHMRCYQLAQRSSYPSPKSPLSTDLPDPACGLALALSHPPGQRLLRSLVALVDHLATTSPERPTPISPQALNQGFLKGYQLCEAVDLWLREIVGQPETPATLLLLQGISLGLAHLLQGWLQATAPTQL